MVPTSPMKAGTSPAVTQQNTPHIYILPHTLKDLLKGTLPRLCIPVVIERSEDIFSPGHTITQDSKNDKAEITLHHPRRILAIKGKCTRTETRVAVHIHYRQDSSRVHLQWNHPTELRQAAKLLNAYLTERLYGGPQRRLTKLLRVHDHEITTGIVALKPPCEPLRFLTGGAENRYRAASGFAPTIDPSISSTYPTLSKANVGYRQSNNYFRQMIAELCQENTP